MKPKLKKINGILLLNKSLNLTSNGALQQVKRLFQAEKAGHTGSLDPLATGMLPICFGQATKQSQKLLDSDKHYHVKVKLGEKTSTGDAEGEVVLKRPVMDISLEKLTKVLTHFAGPIQQIPPMYSAIKHKGTPLYKLARQGIEIERKPRSIHIHATKLIDYADQTFTFDVHCSKGTYIRTLVEDMGEMLGCGAYTMGLHRTAVMPYLKERMYQFDELEEIAHQKGLEGLLQCLVIE